MKRIALGLALLCVAAGTFALVRRPERDESRPAVVEPAQFVGSAACASCHAAEHRAWQQSNHHRAMAAATDETVLGDFADRTFDYHGRSTRFTRSEGRFVVTTENEAGQLEAFPVAFTLGVEPLQQYLVRFPDGRLQALPFAWDSRPASAGGQRWFHLYAEEDVTPKSPLFWTRPLQNWDHMCGECHTTDFQKRFADARFDTQFKELGNGCESCHGAGSAHVRSAKREDLIALGTQSSQIDQCGVCHARRTRLSHPVAGIERMHDTWRPELLQDGLYFVDGQIHDEVFEVGSFLQSKMAARGVMCTNCHDPHSAMLKAQGNALCTQCHEARYDSPQHHFHRADAAGSRCVDCHMPTRTYMGVDVRRDHRIAVPRPDLSDSLGTPNACGSCHGDKSNAWAADAIRQHGGGTSTTPSLGPVHAEVQHEEAQDVTQFLAEPLASGIAKGTLVADLGAQLVNAPALVHDADPWVRLGTATAFTRAGTLPAPALLEVLMKDPSRSVRHAVAPLLARVPESALSASARQQRSVVLDEYRAWLANDADRAEALVSAAILELTTGNSDAAERLLEAALKRDPTSLGAHLNLAELKRRTRDEAGAERLLREAAELFPESADVRHSLGLLLVRTQRSEAGVVELGRASELAPSNIQYAYVYAVALHETHQAERALTVLRAAQTRFPENAQIRQALEAYCAQPGAARHAACGP